MPEPGKAPLHYTHVFYDELVERAQLEKTSTGEVLVFRGKLMDVFADLKVSQHYYTIIRRILLEHNCIEYLQRGTKAYDSVIVLRHPPPKEISSKDLTRDPSAATLRELAHRVTALESWRETVTGSDSADGGLNIGQALITLEKRLARLERVDG